MKIEKKIEINSSDIVLKLADSDASTQADFFNMFAKALSKSCDDNGCYQRQCEAIAMYLDVAGEGVVNRIHSTIEQTEEQAKLGELETKEIELVMGNWYTSDWGRGVCVFRFKSEQERQSNHDRIINIFSLHLPNEKEDEYNTKFYDHERSYKAATPEQIAFGEEREANSGYFWESDFDGYLTIKDICYKTKSKQELLEIANIIGVDRLGGGYSFDIDYTFIVFNDEDLFHNNFNDPGKKQVSKEMFLKLLK